MTQPPRLRASGYPSLPRDVVMDGSQFIATIRCVPMELYKCCCPSVALPSCISQASPRSVPPASLLLCCCAFVLLYCCAQCSIDAQPAWLASSKVVEKHISVVR